MSEFCTKKTCEMAKGQAQTLACNKLALKPSHQIFNDRAYLKQDIMSLF